MCISRPADAGGKAGVDHPTMPSTISGVPMDSKYAGCRESAPRPKPDADIKYWQILLLKENSSSVVEVQFLLDILKLCRRR